MVIILGYSWTCKSGSFWIIFVGKNRVATSSNETLDFDVLSIEPGTWAVFESIGPFPETLQNVWVDEGNSKVGPRNSPKFRP